MPTLKEIKGRIGSVKSTLKITSAMKLVSSAKLRKAQNAIAAMRPYEEALQRMLALASAGRETPDQVGGDGRGTVSADERTVMPGAGLVMPDTDRASHSVIIAIASNSSLCGGFNANVISKVRSVRREGDVVYSIGRKMADAMARDGFRSPADYSALSEHPSYAQAAAIVEKLSEDFAEGRIGGVKLVYTHFVSTSRQVPVEETLLPVSSVMPDSDRASGEENDVDVILEPSAKDLLRALLPKTLKLKLYAALLDSAAAEHAARTIAMQTATDNAENLLSELTLQYNKGRQQKITSEILDLAGGQAAE